MLRRGGVGLVVGLLAALAPGAAGAAPAHLDFESLPHNTIVSDQYGGDGIVFGPTPAKGHPLGNQPVVQDVGGAQAHSGKKVGVITHNCIGEFCPADFAAYIVKGTRNVGMRAGNLGACPGIRVELSGYSSDGVKLDTRSRAVSEKGALQYLFLKAGSNEPDISYIRLVMTDGCLRNRLAIDDVTFDKRTVGPSFVLNWADQGVFQESLLIPAGPPAATAKATIAVERYGGSTGALSFAVTGAPAGTAAKITPNPDDTATLEVDTASDTPPLDAVLTITASGPASAGTGAPLTIPLRVTAQYDVRVTGIDVQQGIQAIGEPLGIPRDDPAPYVRTYDSAGWARLAKGQRTIVRVYGEATKVPGSVCRVDGVTASLSATAGGKALPGSPLLPDTPPRSLGNPLLFDSACGGQGFATARQRTESAFQFTLPPEWTERDDITLSATVNPPVAGSYGLQEPPALSECANCALNNTVQLLNVPFTEVSRYPTPDGLMVIEPWDLKITYDPKAGSTDGVIAGDKDTPALLAYALLLVPHREGAIRILPNGEIDLSWIYKANTMTDVFGSLAPPFALSNADRDDLALQALEQLDNPANDLTLGLVQSRTASPALDTQRANGLANGDVVFRGEPAAVVEVDRPLTSVGHELHHMFGREHASACGGGGAGGQIAEPWPPDHRGLLGGISANLLPAARDGEGFSPINVDLTGPTSSWLHDFMSYCGVEFATWISLRGWNAQHAFFSNVSRGIAAELAGSGTCTNQDAACPDPQALSRAAPRARAAAAASRAPAGSEHIRIGAFERDGRTILATIGRTRARTPASGVTSGLTLRLVDAKGGV
ncbi:MAG TPA: hypothetical protein VFZ89_08880, partial [Solirubrobacteraceae bacterium]